MDSSTSSVSVNLSLGQDISNCVPFVTCRIPFSAAIEAERRFVRARFLSGPDRIVLDRGDAAGEITGIEVFVVEFNATEVTVQAVTATSSAQTVNNAITAVDLAKTFAVVTMSDGGGDDDADHMFRDVDFSSTTNLRYRNYGASGTYDFSGYVIEDIGSNWDVQTVTWTSDNTTQEDETITAVDMSTTFLYGAYRSEEAFNSPPDDSSATAELLNTTTVRITLPAATSDDRSGTIFVVECDASVAEVQRGSMSMTSLDTDTDTITAVDLDRSMATLVIGPPGTTTSGRSDSSGGDDWDEAQCTIVFNSTTEVECERDNGGSQTDLSWEVVEWLESDPANTPEAFWILG